MPPKVICVVGPTASGKTKMGVALAKTFDGEVVSVDSMQIYRGMAIGTAAPTPEETEGIPHHMVGVADPRESWSVARFTEEADACVQDILHRGKRPVLVGGTGLYLDSLVRGGDFAPGRSGGAVRERLQRELAERGAPAMLECLREVDPESAARLHLRDEKRILRALEVYEETGETITAHNRRTQERPPRYDALYICLLYTSSRICSPPSTRFPATISSALCPPSRRTRAISSLTRWPAAATSPDSCTCRCSPAATGCCAR